MALNLGSVVAGDGDDHLTSEPLRRTAGGIPRLKPLPVAEGLILNQAQAEAVYGAMCALNNVSARLQAFDLDADGLQVLQRANGTVVVGYLVSHAARANILESYADQAAFATTYGLQQGWSR